MLPAYARQPGISVPRGPQAEVPPHAASAAQRARLAAAAVKARETLPGAIGAYIADELDDAANWGYALGSTARIQRVADQLLNG